MDFRLMLQQNTVIPKMLSTMHTIKSRYQRNDIVRIPQKRQQAFMALYFMAVHLQHTVTLERAKYTRHLEISIAFLALFNKQRLVTLVLVFSGFVLGLKLHVTHSTTLHH